MKRMVWALVLMSCISLVVMPADAADYTLEIFGNANMDDEIDEDDITYVEGIVEGTNEETLLADANFDSAIDEDDITQIEQIIRGEEGELTIIDSAGRTVTVKKPVKSIVVLTYPVLEATKIVEAEDGVVGVSKDIKSREVFFPELSKLPSVGVASAPDVEKIIDLNPDLVFTGRLLGVSDGLEEMPSDSIAVVRWDMGRLEMMTRNVKKLGYVLDEEDSAEEFCDFYDEYVEETIKARIEEIPDEDRERVFIEHPVEYNTFVTGSGGHEICVAAGGINIAADFPSLSPKPVVNVNPEWLVEQDPNVIVKTVTCTPGLCGPEANSSEEMEGLRGTVMNRSGWSNLTAVKNGRVYLIDFDLVGSTANFVGATYLAKWLYPDLFADLDPKAIHQEYLTRFQRLDCDLDERGVFVCPNR
ncbi:MAG TPA: ABC transporter substrate-binding protein [Methanothrix sp.]|nr:ABC transporter substrate-binding protein [Methanothrix sp.]HPJ83811.1 ABC transporter substrate-binding protein [Methanothrix sp.]HPR66091.1 ABC transporter substrate-binding protein [Methanothrix sp.]